MSKEEEKILQSELDKLKTLSADACAKLADHVIDSEDEKKEESYCAACVAAQEQYEKCSKLIREYGDTDLQRAFRLLRQFKENLSEIVNVLKK